MPALLPKRLSDECCCQGFVRAMLPKKALTTRPNSGETKGRKRLRQPSTDLAAAERRTHPSSEKRGKSDADIATSDLDASEDEFDRRDPSNRIENVSPHLERCSA